MLNICLSFNFLQSAYIGIGRQKEAQETAEYLFVKLTNFTIDAADQYFPLRLDKDWAQVIDGLTKAGVPER